MSKDLTRKSTGQLLMDNAIIIVLLFLLIGFVIKDPAFLSLTNVSNILSQASTNIIIALGVAGLIVTQGTDLSAGRQVGLAAVISASLLQSPENVSRMYQALPPVLSSQFIIVALIIACIACGFLGFLNGVVIAHLKVTPFITTLGSMIIIYGLSSTYVDREPNGAQPIGGFTANFTEFAQGGFDIGSFRLPYLVIYAAITTVFMWVLWNKTRFGKNMFAVGGNPEAAVVSGVNIKKTLISVYTLAGVLYGLAGTLEAARIGTATNNTGNMYELDAIAACVVGGVSFTGGIGKIGGVIIGVLMFQIISYGLNFSSVSPYWQYIIKGLIIIAAVAIDTRKYLKKN
ncbi:Galactoside transport system permease protein MglC [Ephemeroptericola cinctiostellae]|uniref:Galactoside transport system permease protein MglC n=1 Tax=Ephemeroptericola cinctiostellae TaxID=2268024 RepID=A0A345DDP3_9BURK|nr:galactose/methyl galactoside ABC transporter permease MglC [Ephemeroptericola cinctiostellae]AXF86481.1 Galactoside transport system permease protein MglC [Ephemeroptericola cinctiostellae]